MLYEVYDSDSLVLSDQNRSIGEVTNRTTYTLEENHLRSPCYLNPLLVTEVGLWSVIVVFPGHNH